MVRALISWVGRTVYRSPRRVSVEVKYGHNPGEHAEHHHGNTHNFNAKSSFNLEQERA